MKKIAFLLLFIFLSSCTSNEDEIIETPTETIIETPAPPAEIEELNQIEETLFYLELREGNIFLDSEIETAIEILGDPVNIHETPSCAFDGFDRIFTFDDFYIHTYPVDDKNFIQIIRFRTDNRTTIEGFRLGDNFDKVTDTLGDDYVRDFNLITFTIEDTSLVFSLQDNIIMDMMYELIMED